MDSRFSSSDLEAGRGVKARLVIELDGSAHEDDEQKENDTRRDKALAELGVRTVRFRNEEILINLSQVVGRIRELISTP